MTHLLKLLDKMYEYEMGPTRTVGTTEWTPDVGRMDGQTDRWTDRWTDDRRSETNIPPNNFVVRCPLTSLFNDDHFWDTGGILAYWGRDEIDAIVQTTFSNAFSWMKMYEFRLRFHWNLFLKFQVNNMPALVQIMAWSRPGDKPLCEPMIVVLLTHICVTRPQWVKIHDCIENTGLIFCFSYLHTSVYCRV